jgi:YegS/Rv2252/BmrU family lipid kinase
VGQWAQRLTSAGLSADVRRTEGPGHATTLARQAAAQGAKLVVAVGGDGTLYEVVNGLMSGQPGTPALGILPLGTGNSFARDFDLHTPEKAFEALVRGGRRPVDVVRATHRDGHLYYINLLSVGFTAEAGGLTNRRFKGLGAAGYVAAVVVCVARLALPRFPHALDSGDVDDAPCVLLSFSNSQYTGGQMRMAPEADPTDGLLDVVRVGPMGRRRLLTVFPRIFSGAHVQAEEIDVRRTKRVDFSMQGPAEVMVDGEVLSLQLKSLVVIPAAVDLVS